MARINSNTPSMVARFNLNRANDNLEVRLNRLATGLRINRGADDPAGLIISERIATDINAVDQAVKNGERASSVISTTEAALSEVNELLNSVKALIVEAANTGGNSKEERDANQLQIDSAIRSITRLSNTATFGGLNLLNGSLDYITSGITSSEITKSKIFGASFIGSTQLQVEVDVIASAQKGGLYMQPSMGPMGANATASAITFQVTGSRGVLELDFPSGTPFTDIVTAVNNSTALTGVEASLINGGATSGVVFNAETYGSSSFVSIERVNTPSGADDPSIFRFGADEALNATFAFTDPGLVTANRDTGQDVQALINGSLANGDGLVISSNNPILSTELTLDETFALDPTGATSTFDIIGGGSMYQLGPDVTALQQVNIGIQSVAASKLGGVLDNGVMVFLSSLQSGGLNDIESNVQANDFSTASDILDEAIDEVTVMRGRLGAFERNVLDTSKRSLQSAIENLSAARSVIRDADFALETTELSRAQILASSGTTVLGLANQQAQSVLQLLG